MEGYTVENRLPCTATMWRKCIITGQESLFVPAGGSSSSSLQAGRQCSVTGDMMCALVLVNNG